jgi:hypothetical protein
MTQGLCRNCHVAAVPPEPVDQLSLLIHSAGSPLDLLLQQRRALRQLCKLGIDVIIAIIALGQRTSISDR